MDLKLEVVANSNKIDLPQAEPTVLLKQLKILSGIERNRMLLDAFC